MKMSWWIWPHEILPPPCSSGCLLKAGVKCKRRHDFAGGHSVIDRPAAHRWDGGCLIDLPSFRQRGQYPKSQSTCILFSLIDSIHTHIYIYIYSIYIYTAYIYIYTYIYNKSATVVQLEQASVFDFASENSIPDSGFGPGGFKIDLRNQEHLNPLP